MLGAAVQTGAARGLPFVAGALTRATPPGQVAIDESGRQVYHTEGPGAGWWSIPESAGTEFANVSSARYSRSWNACSI